MFERINCEWGFVINLTDFNNSDLEFISVTNLFSGWGEETIEIYEAFDCLMIVFQDRVMRIKNSPESFYNLFDEYVCEIDADNNLFVGIANND